MSADPHFTLRMEVNFGLLTDFQNFLPLESVKFPRKPTQYFLSVAAAPNSQTTGTSRPPCRSRPHTLA